jgi:hypothetical protein
MAATPSTAQLSTLSRCAAQLLQKIAVGTAMEATARQWVVEDVQHATVFKARHLLHKAGSWNMDEQDKQDGKEKFAGSHATFLLCVSSMQSHPWFQLFFHVLGVARRRDVSNESPPRRAWRHAEKAKGFDTCFFVSFVFSVANFLRPEVADVCFVAETLLGDQAGGSGWETRSTRGNWRGGRDGGNGRS